MTKTLIKIAISLIIAAICYFAWMAAFILATELNNPGVEAVLWLLAPVITAAGFAVGIAIVERFTRTANHGFFRIFIWPLIGCALGAIVVYWFGPMLIVFGMFAAGTVSVAIREFIISPKE